MIDKPSICFICFHTLFRTFSTSFERTWSWKLFYLLWLFTPAAMCVCVLKCHHLGILSPHDVLRKAMVLTLQEQMAKLLDFPACKYQWFVVYTYIYIYVWFQCIQTTDAGHAGRLWQEAVDVPPRWGHDATILGLNLLLHGRRGLRNPPYESIWRDPMQLLVVMNMGAMGRY